MLSLLQELGEPRVPVGGGEVFDEVVVVDEADLAVDVAHVQVVLELEQVVRLAADGACFVDDEGVPLADVVAFGSVEHLELQERLLGLAFVVDLDVRDDELVGADLDDHVDLELQSADDLDVGACGAADVFEEEVVVAEEDFCVVAGDAFVQDDHLVVRVAADLRSVFFDVEEVRLRAFDGLQDEFFEPLLVCRGLLGVDVPGELVGLGRGFFLVLLFGVALHPGDEAFGHGFGFGIFFPVDLVRAGLP